MRTRKWVVAVLVAALGVPSVVEAVGKDKVAYAGGTLSGVKEKAEGNVDTRGDALMWVAGNRNDGSPITIPYANVTQVEYGQKAGRRVVSAVLLSPVALFMKRRCHYMTVTFKDDAGQEQVAVFELGKEIVRATVKSVSVRSGKEIEFTDEEGRKNFAH